MKAIRLYAQVLVDVITAPNSGMAVGDVLGELSQFSKLFDESPLFLKVFESPNLPDEDKQKVLKEFSGKVKLSAISSRFLSLLSKRNRMALLPKILREVERIQVERNGGLIGELTSAVALDSGTAANVAQALSKKLNKPVQLKQKIDPTIIAGMRVTIGGVTYDGSVKSKLERLAAGFTQF